MNQPTYKTTLDSGEKAYTEEACAALRDKQIALLNLFYENGDFSFYHTHLCEAHREQAAYYARIGNSEQTLFSSGKSGRTRDKVYNIQ